MSDNLTSGGGGENQNVVRINAVVIGGTAVGKLPEGFAKRSLTQSRVIFEPGFKGELARNVAGLSDAEAMCLANFRRLGSPTEHKIFDAVTRDIAHIASALEDVRVSNAETGAAWALGLRPIIFRELYAAYALEQLIAQGHETITIVMRALGSCENAILARLQDYHATGRINFTGLSQIKDGVLSSAEPKAVFETLARIRHLQTQSAPPLPAITGERIVGDLKVFEGDNPVTADVLFLHLTPNRMFHANIPPILAELKTQKRSAAVLVFADTGLEIYDTIFEHAPQNIIRLKEGVEPTDNNQIERLREAINARVLKLGGGIVGLDSLSPLLAANDKSYCRRTLSRLMVFHNAFNVILGRSKPRALYLSQSPDTHPIAYLALSIGQTRITPYYSFSSFVTEDTRSLPFISPAFLLAYGDHDRDIVKRRSPVAGEAAIVTGMPSLDGITVEDGASMREALLAETGLPHDQPIVTIKTSRHDPDAEDRWITPFIRWCYLQDISVILAENPRKGTKDYTRPNNMAQARDWENIVVLSGVDATNRALAGASLVISDQPEQAMAGLIAGRVFIHAKFDSRVSDSLGDGTGFIARSEPELRDIVSGVILDEDYIPEALIEQRQRLADLLNKAQSGNAAERVVEALLAERAQVAFENPFLEVRLIDNALQTLDVVPRMKLLYRARPDDPNNSED